MRTLFITIFILFSVAVSAKSVIISSSNVKSFVTVDNSKYYVFLKCGKKYELYNKAQLDALKHLVFVQESIETKVK